jgi:hypothetical protein
MTDQEINILMYQIDTLTRLRLAVTQPSSKMADTDKSIVALVDEKLTNLLGQIK